MPRLHIIKFIMSYWPPKHVAWFKIFTGVVNLAWVNVLLTLPYILVNGCIYYVDQKYDYYKSKIIEENIWYANLFLWVEMLH